VCAILHGVGGLQPGHDLAAGKDLDPKLVVARFGNRLGEDFGGTIKRIERFRIARGEPPAQLRHGLRDRRRGDGRRRGAGRCGFKEIAASHGPVSLKLSLFAQRWSACEPQASSEMRTGRTGGAYQKIFRLR